MITREVFDGVKVALLVGNDELIVIQRDEKPGLRWAGMWDFPGGAREESETPFECASREISEELGLRISQEMITWKRQYPSMHDPNLCAYFMVAKISKSDVDQIILGDEGQRWNSIKVKDFLADQNVIEGLKDRLSNFLASV